MQQNKEELVYAIVFVYDEAQAGNHNLTNLHTFLHRLTWSSSIVVLSLLKFSTYNINFHFKFTISVASASGRAVHCLHCMSVLTFCGGSAAETKHKNVCKFL